MNFEGDDIALQDLPTPVFWRVLLGKVKKDEKTAGGIILPDDVKRYMENGLSVMKVLAMGPLCFKDEKFKHHSKEPSAAHYKVGDIVVIGKFTGQDLVCNGGDVLKICNDDEVIAVINNINLVEI